MTTKSGDPLPGKAAPKALVLRPRAELHFRQGLAALVLFVATLAVFAPAFHFPFVDYDDNLYVTKMPIVEEGLTPEAVRFAFTTPVAAIWHPLTMLSLMTDVELFGPDPQYLHRTNIALHVANVLLLFAILGAATGAWGRSFFAAGLFAIHPLHVESVAWIAERKDVLSTFFGLLAIGAYFRYAWRPSPWRYAATCVLFALSLLAKPMFVTLPALLLLLDIWPLGRLPWPFGTGTEGEPPIGLRPFLRLVTPRLLEKLPLLAFSLASSAVAYWAQSLYRAIEDVPPAIRWINALLSLVRYLKKTVFPVNLAAYYPYSNLFGIDQALVYGGILALLTLVAFRLGRRSPYVPVGWLWYLIALLPVIGLVQIGTQSMADRYTYMPLIGIFVIVAWGAEALRERLRLAPGVAPALGVLLLVVMGGLARRQVLVWKDTRTLFEHANAVTGGSSFAYSALAALEIQEGHLQSAAEDVRAAKHLSDPFVLRAYVLGGLVAELQGDTEEAEREFREVIARAPAHREGYLSLGLLYLKTGRPEQAMPCFGELLRLDPEDVEARALLGSAREQAALRQGAQKPQS